MVWKDFVDFDKRYLRPAEVDVLIGDPTKAQTVLGWKRELSFDGLVKLMVDSDLAAIGQKPIGQAEVPDVATVRRQMIGAAP